MYTYSESIWVLVISAISAAIAIYLYFCEDLRRQDKTIFLDIDGVLNVIGQGRDEYGQKFHKHFEDNLRWIVEHTGAKLVITSTWRSNGLIAMKEMWKHRNLPGEIIGITPYSESRIRGEEIKMWLDKNPVARYVIIDDNDDMLEEQMPFLVQTFDNTDHHDCVDIGYGLTRKCAERAINILNDNFIQSKF